jgi:hypothetical protein
MSSPVPGVPRGASSPGLSIELAACIWAFERDLVLFEFGALFRMVRASLRDLRQRRCGEEVANDAQPSPLRKRCNDMTEHPTMHPMTSFNPSEPAVLHDLAGDQIITWIGDEADDFRRSSRARDDGTVAWREYVFDGWGNVMGG